MTKEKIKKLKQLLGFIEDKKLKERVEKEAGLEEGIEIKEKYNPEKDEVEIDITGLHNFFAKISNIVQRHWVKLALLLIVFLAFYIRIFAFNYPYLINIDSYYFYRYMNFIVEDGKIPDIDPYMLAPEGLNTRSVPKFYMYLGAYSYLFFKHFLPNLELWRYLIYFPAAIAALCAIPVYFIGKYLFDRKAGVIAAFFLIFNPFNMTRTLGGDPDSDGIVLLMTLVPVALFLATQKSIERDGLKKQPLLLSVATGIALALFAHTWGGSWYVVWLFAGFVVLKLIAELVIFGNFKKTWKQNKNNLVSLFVIFLIFSLLVVPFFGISKIVGIIESPFGALRMKSEAARRFPNVWVSIAEMMSPEGKTFYDKINTIATRATGMPLGGISTIVHPFFLAVYSMLYFVISYTKRKKHLDSLIFMFLWFIGPLYASIVAVRFVILLSTPLIVLSSIALAKLFDIIMGKDILD
ncbi:MAG: hypothetical protein J7K31_02790 [Candidatus Aenigmarchaeota archaeon]|nr:hypothetical protein [Candidatus Aenigmarchaeota archaeon]